MIAPTTARNAASHTSFTFPPKMFIQRRGNTLVNGESDIATVHDLACADEIKTVELYPAQYKNG